MTTQPVVTDASSVQADSEQLFEYISSYSFHADQEYQSGLATILGHPETPASAQEITENQDLVLQAQCFYLARKHNLPTIDLDGYKSWFQAREEILKSTRTNGTPETSGLSAPDPIERPHAPTPRTAAAASTLNVQPHSQTTNTDRPAEVANTTLGQGPAPPYPTSFADIVDLITQNKPVPGIEEVPDTVLELGSSKRDTATRRRKPWEKDDDDGGGGSSGVGVLGTGGVHTESNGRNGGQGVLKILQPGAIPDSGLIAGD